MCVRVNEMKRKALPRGSCRFLRHLDSFVLRQNHDAINSQTGIEPVCVSRLYLSRTNHSARWTPRDPNEPISALGGATRFKSEAHTDSPSVAAEGGCVAEQSASRS